MTTVQTALGPIATTELGPTLMHEHVVTRSPGVQENWPHLWDRNAILDIAERKMADLYRRGIRSIVDLTTVDLGRDIDLILAVARRSRVHIVVATGVWWMPQRYFSVHGVDGYLKTANDQSLMIVLIEDIVAVRSLDEILKVDHIDCFFVAPSDLATSMGQIGNMGHPEVQQTIDGAIKKIVQSGRVAGTLVNVGNVERYTRLGVRVVMTSFFPWIQAGAKELIERAAAGARG